MGLAQTKEDQLKRMKEFEEENQRLRKAVNVLTLDERSSTRDFLARRAAFVSSRIIRHLNWDDLLGSSAFCQSARFGAGLFD